MITEIEIASFILSSKQGTDKSETSYATQTDETDFSPAQ